MSSTSIALRHAQEEIAAGKRFEFGRNWQRFLRTLKPARIAQAEQSLRSMLGVTDLAGRSFLDIGSGSGLFSLAARRLGARVVSFDFDPQSVACAQQLKAQYFAGDTEWTIHEGSVLDQDFLDSLGTFDVVYSWGVLHHTGAMWPAIDNATKTVARGGQLFIGIYNYQPVWTRVYTVIKRVFVASPAPVKWLLAGVLFPLYAAKGFVADVARGRNPLARFFSEDSRIRGMSWWYDIWDWIGGYPFETAKPEAIVDFCHERGFILDRMTTCGGRAGCNQFVFRRESH